MKTNKIFYLIALTLVFVIEVHAQRRIVGGQNVDISQRPYQAAVIVWDTESDTYGAGGGVILNNNWILTAAHNVVDTKISDIKISTGHNDFRTDFNKSSVAQVIIYPDYQYNDTMDLALVRLSTPLTFNENRQAINLSQATTYSYNTLATVSGWGRTSYTSTANAQYLQKTDIRIKTQSRLLLKSLTSSGHSYYGDSGSPLTISTSYGDKLIGIVKGSQGTPPNIISCFVNIGNYYDWIYNTINNNTIVGDDIINTSGVYTVNINGNYTVKVDGVLSSVTKNGRQITVNGSGSGAANIYVYIDNTLIAKKNIWVGVPIVYGIQVDGNYFRLMKSAYNQHITKTNWTIGSNQFSTNDDFIYNPYASSGSTTSQEIKVTVSASNKNGTSKPYSTTITYSKSKVLNVSRVGDSNVFRLTQRNDDVTTLADYKITYQLINMRQASVSAIGTLNIKDGVLDLNGISKGLYMLKLTDTQGHTETLKIIIK